MRTWNHLLTSLFLNRTWKEMKKSCESVLFLQLDADPAVCQTVFKLDDYDYVNMLVVYFQMVSIYCCNVKYIIQSSIVRKPSTAQVDYKQYLFFSIVHCEYERDLRSNEHHLTVQIYYFHILTVIYSPLHGFIWNQFDQLPIGLLARVVEYCTGIAEVIGSNPVQA